MTKKTAIMSGILGLLFACSNGAPAGQPHMPAAGDPWATIRVQAAELRDSEASGQGAQVYTSCASCHLADGGGRPDGAIPRIAGQPAQILVAKLENIRDRGVMLPVMDAFVMSLSPAEITAVAGYIAALPAPAFIGQGSGESLAAGQKHYGSACAACHGEHAEGNAALRAPRLCGQHAGYILRRVDEIVHRIRADADAGMAAISAGFLPGELAAIADYLSRASCEPLPGEAQ